MISWVRSSCGGGKRGCFGAEDGERGAHVLGSHGREGDDGERAGEERAERMAEFMRGDGVVGGGGEIMGQCWIFGGWLVVRDGG